MPSYHFNPLPKLKSVRVPHLTNLTHAISVSVKEADEGWIREIRHPSGFMIEIFGSVNATRWVRLIIFFYIQLGPSSRSHHQQEKLAQS